MKQGWLDGWIHFIGRKELRCENVAHAIFLPTFISEKCNFVVLRSHDEGHSFHAARNAFLRSSQHLLVSDPP